MRACWLKWVGRDWSISADYIWLNYSDANIGVWQRLRIAAEHRPGGARASSSSIFWTVSLSCLVSLP